MARTATRRYSSSGSRQPSRVEDLPLVLTVGQFRTALQLGRRQAYKWVQDNPDRICRLGRSIRIPRRVIEELLGERADGDVD
jgi:hypothetical protein